MAGSGPSSPDSDSPTQCRPAPQFTPLTPSRPGAPAHVALPVPLPPSTLLSLHSGASFTDTALSPGSPRSAPHTPPSPVHRPIPLPPVTPYDTPMHTNTSSPLFGAVHGGREVSPLRPAGATSGFGAGLALGDRTGHTASAEQQQRGSSLLQLAEPLAPPLDSPRTRSRSEPSHPPSPRPELADPFESAVLSDSDDRAPSGPPPAYTRHASGSDLPPPPPPPPFSPGPTQLLPMPVPSHPAGYRPLDPPPDCFSTPGPWRVRSRDFAPFHVRSLSSSLAQGWEGVWAPALEAHGITQADWARFLGDLTHTAALARDGISALSPKRASHPPSGIRTLLSGPWAAEGGPYDQAFRRTEPEEVAALLGVWNGSAWERRRVRVSLRVVPDELGERRERWELLVEAL
ncbi:hypothetical protein CALCODRAFT_507373 [Calocera cornea HHB12733]|uniref:Uncharacterized protein n=1 Tax=Calocera cornea HHB12733 TaxID=1353952 RepID=A0A165HRQ4_9BASI|nr:hypothetical protein CALCODRAFT_507373 [Calocera cornea HHB12733]